MKAFTYSYPIKVYFGQDAAARELPGELLKKGQTVMLAYGGGSIKKNGIYEEMMGILKAAGKKIIEFGGIMPNPTYAKVQEGAALARREKVDFILAVGGGSVIDCCKIVAAQAVTEKDLWEMEFQDHQYPNNYLSLGAVVTASGTGAEMNNGAVITHEEKKLKAGVLGAYADFAILDPAYTLSLPMGQAVSGAFDTLSHCMETYFGTPRDENLSDRINEAIMVSVISNIRKMIKNPQDLGARSELMWASAMAENGILKIGKVTDFQAHQLEHQLGAYTDCNHGQGLAVIHPVLYRHICQEAIPKFARFASVVWGIPDESKTAEELAFAGIGALQDFIHEIGLPGSFREMGITDRSVLKMVADTSNLTAGCCKKLTREELLEIMDECF